MANAAGDEISGCILQQTGVNVQGLALDRAGRSTGMLFGSFVF